MQWSQIQAQNRDFCLPHLHSTPPLGGSLTGGFCRNIAVLLGREKLEWLGYPMVKMFIRFDRIHEIDRQTHAHTHTPHDDIGRACIASRSKNETEHRYNASQRRGPNYVITTTTALMGLLKWTCLIADINRQSASISGFTVERPVMNTMQMLS